MQNMLAQTTRDHLIKLDVPLCVVLPDGRQITGALGRKTAPRLTLKSWHVLSDLVSGELGVIGADLVEGRLHYEGSMRQLMDIAQRLLQIEPHLNDRGVVTRFLELGMHKWRSAFAHNRANDAANVHSHYDVSDEFYALWLDPLRVYSCAYFADHRMQLEQAQQAKLDLICRKLMLKEGERFLDMGMGWGGLLIWAAEHYGVKATGVTLSTHQYMHVFHLIREKRLEDRVQIHLMDYRDVSESHPFDKVASVGMFEHVGRINMKAYFAKIWRLLKPGGMLMNHGITAGGMGYHQIGLGIGDFIEKYIFPGGELLHVSDVLRYMGQANLELVDAENLRPHYAKTLWSWSDRLEHKLDEARAILQADHGKDAEKILQAYRLYLAGCAVGFERGWTLLYQLLAIRNDAPSDYPFTRQHLFAADPVQHSPAEIHVPAIEHAQTESVRA